MCYHILNETSPSVIDELLHSKYNTYTCILLRWTTAQEVSVDTQSATIVLNHPTEKNTRMPHRLNFNYWLFMFCLSLVRVKNSLNDNCVCFYQFDKYKFFITSKASLNIFPLEKFVFFFRKNFFSCIFLFLSLSLYFSLWHSIIGCSIILFYSWFIWLR